MTDNDAIARILAMTDEEALAGVPPEKISALQTERDTACAKARSALALSPEMLAAGSEAALDSSPADYHGLSQDAIASILLVAWPAMIAISTPSPALRSGGDR